VVTEASEAERHFAILALARHLQQRLGAPSFDSARAAAQEEVDFAASLCGDPVGTVIALHRTVAGGEIREQFRSLHRREPGPSGTDRLHGQARAFEFVETEDVPEERVDLVGLIKDER
jgi:hypothetical protein